MFKRRSHGEILLLLSNAAIVRDLHFKKTIQAKTTRIVRITLATTKTHQSGATPTVVGASGDPVRSKIPVLKIV